MPPKNNFWFWKWKRQKMTEARKRKKDDEDNISDEDQHAKKKQKTKKSSSSSEYSPSSKGKKSICFQVVMMDRFGTQLNLKKEKKQQVEDLFRSFEDARHDPRSGNWTFPLKHYETIIKQLEEYAGLNLTVEITNRADQQQPKPFEVKPIPKEVLKIIRSDKIQLTRSLQEGDTGKAKSSSFVIDTSTKTIEDLDLSNIPPDLMNTLLPFQVKSIEFGLSRQGRCLIGDEPGLGKTLQAIALAACYVEEWPLLVICPSNLRLNWRREIMKWLPSIVRSGSGHETVHVVTSGKDSINYPVTILSYDLVAKFYDRLEQQHYQVIIADESHFIKNTEAKRTQNLVPLLQASRRAILLTGTPSLGSPVELYPQLNSIGLNIFKSFKQFGLRYCNAFIGPYGWDYKGHSNLRELHLILQKTIMIRRLKKDVLKELPPKSRKKVYIELSEEDRQQLRDATKGQPANIAAEDLENLGQGQSNSPGIMQLWMETGKAKSHATCDYLHKLFTEKKILEGNATDKIIIFAHHLEVMDIIETFLQRLKIGYIRIDGSTKPEERFHLVNKFQAETKAPQTPKKSVPAPSAAPRVPTPSVQHDIYDFDDEPIELTNNNNNNQHDYEDDVNEFKEAMLKKYGGPTNIQVALLSITVAGCGITLHKANAVVFAELHWTPGQLIQAEDRAHRIGKAQTDPLEIHYLIAKHTVDEKVWDIIGSKLEVVGETLDGQLEEIFDQRRYEAANRIRYSDLTSPEEQQQEQGKKKKKTSKQQPLQLAPVQNNNNNNAHENNNNNDNNQQHIVIQDSEPKKKKQKTEAPQPVVPTKKKAHKPSPQAPQQPNLPEPTLSKVTEPKPAESAPEKQDTQKPKKLVLQRPKLELVQPSSRPMVPPSPTKSPKPLAVKSSNVQTEPKQPSHKKSNPQEDLSKPAVSTTPSKESPTAKVSSTKQSNEKPSKAPLTFRFGPSLSITVNFDKNKEAVSTDQPQSKKKANDTIVIED